MSHEPQYKAVPHRWQQKTLRCHSIPLLMEDIQRILAVVRVLNSLE